MFSATPLGEAQLPLTMPVVEASVDMLAQCRSTQMVFVAKHCTNLFNNEHRGDSAADSSFQKLWDLEGLPLSTHQALNVARIMPDQLGMLRRSDVGSSIFDPVSNFFRKIFGSNKTTNKGSDVDAHLSALVSPQEAVQIGAHLLNASSILMSEPASSGELNLVSQLSAGAHHGGANAMYISITMRNKTNRSALSSYDDERSVSWMCRLHLYERNNTPVNEIGKRLPADSEIMNLLTKSMHISTSTGNRKIDSRQQIDSERAATLAKAIAGSLLQAANTTMEKALISEQPPS